MTADEIIELATGMPGAVAVTASEMTGAPEVAWGDTFFFHGEDRRLPFATIVIKDYDGFDAASNLNRPGVFRLSIAVGRETFEELIGYPPAAHAAHQANVDYAALDRVLPHPVYAAQSWVCILNPGAASDAQARELLAHAHRRASRR